jgi:hypothetical protein
MATTTRLSPSRHSRDVRFNVTKVPLRSGDVALDRHNDWARASGTEVACSLVAQ